MPHRRAPATAKARSNAERKSADSRGQTRRRFAHGLPPHSIMVRLAKGDQSVARESAAEQQQPRNILAFEQKHRLRQLAAGAVAIAGMTGEQAEVQARHGECRIEMSGEPIMLHGALAVAGMLAAERQHVMGAGVQLIEQEKPRQASSARCKLTGCAPAAPP